MLSAVDLFCGAGGTSTGLVQTCRSFGIPLDLAAVNHWPRAVSSHELNHPDARHFCADVGALSPRRAVPSGSVDLIVAGVECTHHSKARGGKPVSDQRRSSGWHVIHWAEQLGATEILVENVTEFQDWGPVSSAGKPIIEKKGETFAAWVRALESLGYLVEWKVLNCANYGDPTSRRRLFVRASRRGAITWPSPTHGPDGDQPWRTAREVIDWSDLGTSIFKRKRKLKPKTLARIAEGIRRFCGVYAEAFLILLASDGKVDPRELPLPEIKEDCHDESVWPFALPHRHGGNNGLMVDDLDSPFRTITASNGSDNYLVSPFLLPQFGERPGQRPRVHSIDEPVPTVTASRGGGAVVMPYVLKYYGTSTVGSIDEPLPTVTAKGQHLAKISPFVLPYYRTGKAVSVDEPLPTVTCRDRFAVVTPDGYAMDIFYRMLKPSELAAAQGFPPGYQFHGNKTEVVRMLGNAVPVNTSAALCRSILAPGEAGEVAA